MFEFIVIVLVFAILYAHYRLHISFAQMKADIALELAKLKSAVNGK
jgi:hypothetical protein